MDNSAFNLDENIIAKLGLQDMPEEQRLALLDQMAELVEKRAMLRIMDELPEDALEEANKLADEPEKLMEFLASKVNILDIMAEETEKLKNEMFLQASQPTADEVAEPPEAAGDTQE
jgi:H2-forming N5,N10-methylenetetrahydromethanopterin dehydrogenase-like enzyme